MKPKEIRPRLSPINSHLGDTLEEAAVGAAYKVAEAENKSFVAAEAVKEAERVSRMAEEAEAFLHLAKEIYDRCNFSHPFFFIFHKSVTGFFSSYYFFNGKYRHRPPNYPVGFVFANSSQNLSETV